jgi:hypothetical protein
MVAHTPHANYCIATRTLTATNGDSCREEEMHLKRKVAAASTKPQSFFGISVPSLLIYRSLFIYLKNLYLFISI